MKGLRRKYPWMVAVVLILAGLLASIGVVLAGVIDSSLADADLTFVGEDIADWAGYFASPAGDVNGDGLGDLIIGAPNGGNPVCPYPDEDPCPVPPKGNGIAYLVLGKPRTDWISDTINLAHADASFLGCYPQSMTARQLYTAGDVNGDGYDDFLVSGWNCSSQPVAIDQPSDHTGKAFLFLGRPDVGAWGSQFPVEQADASFLGEREWDFTSYYVATTGDVNGDGLDDFLVTCTKYDIIENDQTIAEEVGKVYLFLGRRDAANYWYADFPVADADASFIGEAAFDHFGRSAVGVGDVNGDGYDDFLVGSMDNDSGSTDAGKNYLFLGGPGVVDRWGQNFSAAGADASFIGEAPGDGVGQRVATAGDVNGDGLSDMLMQAARNDQVAIDAGKAYLVLGRRDADWGDNYPLAQADASFLGEVSRDEAGRRVGGIGDVNHDGYDDFIIGAPHSSQGGELAGVAYLLYGRPQSGDWWGLDYPLALSEVTFIGKPLPGSAGYDMGWLDDFDGDGIDDYFIVAFGGRHETESPGEVYVLFGGKTPLAMPENPQPTNFTPQTTEGATGSWYWFTTDYRDRSGWQDIEQVRMMLSTGLDVSPSVDTTYVASTNVLYLSGSLGSCTLGENRRLFNGVAEVDCYSTQIKQLDADTMRVLWRVRWATSPVDITIFTSYLPLIQRAFDVSGLLQSGSAMHRYRADAEYLGSNGWQGSEEIPVAVSSSSGVSLETTVLTDTITFNAYLRAIDLAGNDSGFVQLGTWTLLVPVVSETPEPVRFIPQTEEGWAELWYWFGGVYKDTTGSQDIEQVRMMLSTSLDVSPSFDTVYVTSTDTLHLSDSPDSCIPGENRRLANGVVEVDCYTTQIEQMDAEAIRVLWRVRWVAPPADATTFNAYLRAIDLTGNDSGFVQLGTWTLLAPVE